MGNLCPISISTGDIVPRCCDWIVKEATYKCKLEDNLKALNEELAQLNARRNDVKWRVALAERQHMEPLNEVQLWLSKVQTVGAEAEEMIENGPQEIQKLRCDGCCSKNCKSSYNFGKQVSKKLADIVKLHEKGVFENVALKKLGAQVDLKPAEPTVGLASTLANIWRLLEEKDVGIIGLCGLGGAGKTTLLTQINNELLKNLIGYDVVIWVVAFKDHTIEKVQQKIGEEIGLSNESWQNKSGDEKAVDIFTWLSEKKFILLLDDVWEPIDLVKIGIPVSNQENDSKLVFVEE